MSAAAETSRRTLGPAWHRRAAGLHVLKLRGSPYEMARQHGALLREAIPHGPLPYYRRYLEKFFRSAGFGPLGSLMAVGLQQTVGRLVARQLPDFAKEVVRGLSDGAGIAHARVLESVTMPDSMLWAVSRYAQLRREPAAIEHRLALELGCSSAVAWGAATKDGKLLHARNFDYQGVGPWTREAAVIFHEPDRGHRYVSVSSAGIPMGGVTAMNDAGLTLTVHQHLFTDATELGGTPIGVVGDIVMREAASLDDAERILARYRPIGCWTYIVTDGKRREVLCWEESPRRQAARRTGPGDTTFRYANIYLDPALGASERALYGSYWRHNQGRYQRLGERLAQGHGRLDPDGMAAILADVGDDGCRLHRAIAMLLTVGSVVFQPEDGVLWVAGGETPTSHNRFEPFDLEREDHAPERGALVAGIPADGAAKEAFDAYRTAYLAYVDDGDFAASRRELERARALQPEQPLYHVAAGVLALVAGEGRVADAAFARALALGHPDPERVATTRLWQGRALDVLGERTRAVSAYQRVLEAPRVDPPVRQAARRGLQRPFRARDARRIRLDFAYADVISP